MELWCEEPNLVNNWQLTLYAVWHFMYSINNSPALYCIAYSYKLMYTYIDNEIDGESFTCLSENDFKELFPKKLGIVKRLCMLQQKVSMCIPLYTYLLSVV